MIHNSKNRYSQNKSLLSALMKKTALNPVAIFLLIVLLYANAIGGMYVGHQSDGSVQANFHALDDVSDLVFSPSESREFSVCGESRENSVDSKLKTRSEYCQFEIVALNCPPGQRYITGLSFLPYSSPNKSPSLPRPPPLSAAKA